MRGLSPRVRGNPRLVARRWLGSGSIPACAGEPGCPRRGRALPWVYPRVCGGTRGVAAQYAQTGGLSPRVRGNRIAVAVPVQYQGSIPACAGEPPLFRQTWRWTRVYPRVCGGTGGLSGFTPGAKGLSPRVRGNRPNAPPTTTPPGSIPACAGEPLIPLCDQVRHRVYPRVCGGTPIQVTMMRDITGLSPRVRGNRANRQIRIQRRRSIPACAGEPVPTL